LKDLVINALKNVYDPEMPVSIWDLGLIYDIAVESSKVSVKMTMTSPTCPMAESIASNVRGEILKVPGVSDVVIDLVWDPPWDISKMSDQARAELDLTGMGW